MDRGAWWAAVPGVAKRQTWLSDWTTIIRPDQVLETCNPEQPVGRQETRKQTTVLSLVFQKTRKWETPIPAPSKIPSSCPTARELTGGVTCLLAGTCRCSSPGPTARASLAGGLIYLQQWQQPSPRPTQPPLYYWAQAGVDLSPGAGSAACFIFLPSTGWPKRPRPSSFCTSPPWVADGHQWHQAGQRGQAAGSKREI